MAILKKIKEDIQVIGMLVGGGLLMGAVLAAVLSPFLLLVLLFLHFAK